MNQKGASGWKLPVDKVVRPLSMKIDAVFDLLPFLINHDNVYEHLTISFWKAERFALTHFMTARMR